MEHCKNCNHSNCTSANRSVCQTVSEMDWERGLWGAAFNGESEKVKALIYKSKNAADAVNTPDNSGYFPLHYAASGGHVDICKILLKYHAQIDAQTRSGIATPLHKAAAAGKLETVKFLICSGAKIDLQDADGQTALHKAVNNKKIDVIEYLKTTFPQLLEIKDCKEKLANEN